MLKTAGVSRMCGQRRLFGVLFPIVFALPHVSQAAPISFPDSFGLPGTLVIQASSSMGNSTLLISASEGKWIGDSWVYNLENPLTFENEHGESIGRLERLVLFTTMAPQVSLNFLVIAGQVETAFSISSDVLSFDPIPGAMGRASAGITVTDLSGNGVSLTGGHGNATKAFRAVVNPIDDTRLFSHLVDNVTLGSGASITSSGIFPLPIGTYSAASQESLLLGTVSSMQSDFSFRLSAFDVAAGTSVFDFTIPEPSTIFLVAGLAVMFHCRPRAVRRRHVISKQ